MIPLTYTPGKDDTGSMDSSPLADPSYALLILSVLVKQYVPFVRICILVSPSLLHLLLALPIFRELR